MRCAKNNLACKYIDGVLVKQSSRKGKAIAISNTPRLGRALWPGARAPAVLTTKSSEIRHTEHDLFLIHHFTEFAAQDLEGPEYGGIYSIQGLILAKEYPFLMHAMIAVAACHLQYLDMDARRYRLPEAFHAQLASQGLRLAVHSISGPKEADSILTAAMLLNALVFYATDDREEQPMIIRQPQWDWLRIQIGITDLLMRTKPFHPKSIWLPLFLATTNIEISEPPQNDLDSCLATFCNVENLSSADSNPYFDFVERLAPVVARDPSPKYSRLYINAVGGISTSFIDMLEKNDTRALLLFAHWSALMCSIDSWWCVRRMRRECWLACNILYHLLDQRHLGLLERPARVCGFLLSS
jgi:hypothetical protein